MTKSIAATRLVSASTNMQNQHKNCERIPPGEMACIPSPLCVYQIMFLMVLSLSAGYISRPNLTCEELEMNLTVLVPLKRQCVVSGKNKSFVCEQPLPGSLHNRIAKVTSTFVILEDISEGSKLPNVTACVGLKSIEKSDIYDLENGKYLQQSMSFDSKRTVGVIELERECWKTKGATCAASVRLRRDVLALPPVAATAERAAFWDFSSPLLGAGAAWAAGLSVAGARGRGVALQGLAGSGLRALALRDARWKGLLPPLALPRLKHLHLEHCGLTAMRHDTFMGSKGIEELRLNKNRFTVVPDCVRHLNKLKSLQIASNYEYLNFTADILSDLVHLEILNLSETPISQWEGTFPPHQNLKWISMANCEVTSLKDQPLDLPALEHMDLRGNYLQYVPESVFINLCNLNYINLSGNNITTWPAFPTIRIFFVDMSFNNLTSLMNLGEVGSKTEYLNVAGNCISEWNSTNIFKVPKSSLNETGDDIGPQNTCEITSRPRDGKKARRDPVLPLSMETRKEQHFLRSLRSPPEAPLIVVETTTESSIFTTMDATNGSSNDDRKQRRRGHGADAWVRWLNLSTNCIEEFSPAMLTSLETLEQVDIGGNPLNCEACSAESLKDWLLAAPQQQGCILEVRCASPASLSGWPLIRAPAARERCQPPLLRLWWALGVPLAAVTAVAVLLTGAAVCYRSEVAYVSHLLRLRGAQRDGLIFDAFVCYSGKDRPFVLRRLVPLLERPERYRLCLFDRGFKLAPHIVRDILKKIALSRKVILVLTPEFVENEWSAWELEMANHKLFSEDRSFLVLLELEPLRRERLPRLLRFLLDTRPLVRWPRPETVEEVTEVGAQLRLVLGRRLGATASTSNEMNTPAPNPVPAPRVTATAAAAPDVVDERTPLLSIVRV